MLWLLRHRLDRSDRSAGPETITLGWRAVRTYQNEFGAGQYKPHPLDFQRACASGTNITRITDVPRHDQLRHSRSGKV